MHMFVCIFMYFYEFLSANLSVRAVRVLSVFSNLVTFVLSHRSLPLPFFFPLSCFLCSLFISSCVPLYSLLCPLYFIFIPSRRSRNLKSDPKRQSVERQRFDTLSLGVRLGSFTLTASLLLLLLYSVPMTHTAVDTVDTIDTVQS